MNSTAEIEKALRGFCVETPEGVSHIQPGISILGLTKKGDPLMTHLSPTPELTLETFQHTSRAIKAEIGKVIVGQDEIVRHTLIAIIAGGHVLLEGVPGLGKTLLIRTLGQALELRFNRVQFTPDLMPADIIGTELLEDAPGSGRRFRFQPGPIFVNLLMADEINRATPKTQSALLEAMQEQTVTVGGHTLPLDRPFFVLATQNPIDMEGTYPLPEAQLDRFLFKLNVTFPGVDDLVDILERTTRDSQPRAETAADGETLLRMGRLARQIPVAEHVSRYVARLLLATHPDQPASPDSVKRFVRFGASPRGAQAMILGAKVNALFEGRYNVAFKDIEAVIYPALRHRLILNFEGEAEGVTTDQVVGEVLRTVERE
jgi:MoxR-like ATPase